LQNIDPWPKLAAGEGRNSKPFTVIHRTNETQFLRGKPQIESGLEQLLKDAPSEKMLNNARIMMFFGILGGMLFVVPFIFLPIGLIMEMSYWSKHTMFRIKTGQTTKKEVLRKGIVNTLVLILGLCVIALMFWRVFTSLDGEDGSIRI